MLLSPFCNYVRNKSNINDKHYMNVFMKRQVDSVLKLSIGLWMLISV